MPQPPSVIIQPQKNTLGIRDSNYDPLDDLIVAQADRPENLGVINLRALSPFLRALLTIDGTVTKYIEAYQMEPVMVKRLSQEFRVLPADHIWLEAPQGTRVIAREVILRGKYSGTLYAYATSLIVLDRLPDQMRNELDVEGGSIGKILLASNLETYREILWYGREQLPKLPEEIGEFAGIDFISRTYRIYSRGLPIMLINERFPSVVDREIAHE